MTITKIKVSLRGVDRDLFYHCSAQLILQFYVCNSHPWFQAPPQIRIRRVLIFQCSVRLFGSLSSNYSDQALDFTAVPDVVFGDITESVLINGQPSTITQQNIPISTSFPKRGYFDQLQDNFGQSLEYGLRYVYL